MTANRILDELQWRGLIRQSTDEAGIKDLLQKSTCVYAGFDPTSDSLHVGHLLPLMQLKRFQDFGHRPICLIGGATGMVGDPSGKSAERNLLDRETLKRNVEGIRNQVQRFLSFEGPNAAVLVNNFDWMENFSFLDFLRDVGKNFPVNVMLSKDSVRSRIERDDGGISYTEFSYMLLQAYDFVYLAKNHQCRLQIGGSDQWGNITAGIDLGRRMLGQQLFGMTCPLLVNSEGQKMGKTERGAVWLDGARTSPYEFYQYFINVADSDVLNVLKLLSDVPQAEYVELESLPAERAHERLAQNRLARSMTKLVHGEEGLESAMRASAILFGSEIGSLSEQELNSIFHDVPSTSKARDTLTSKQLSLIDGLVETGLCKSRGEARRALEAGSIYLNNRRESSNDRVFDEKDLVAGNAIVLRSGKKKYAIIRFDK
jgi:tyrosyl-tRNA synthetase